MHAFVTRIGVQSIISLKNSVISLRFNLIIPSVLANGMHNGGHEGDTSIGYQFEEILPFHSWSAPKIILLP